MAQVLEDLGRSTLTGIHICDISLPQPEDQIKHDGIIKIICMVNIKNNSAGGKIPIFRLAEKCVYCQRCMFILAYKCRVDISVELIGDLSLCVAECSGQCLVVVVFLQDGSKLSISVCVCVCMCVYVCVWYICVCVLTCVYVCLCIFTVATG